MHCFKVIPYVESIQYNPALTITEAIKGTSREKIYSELGLELLEDVRWYRKLCVFYKILNTITHIYLTDIILPEHVLAIFLY